MYMYYDWCGTNLHQRPRSKVELRLSAEMRVRSRKYVARLSVVILVLDGSRTEDEQHSYVWNFADFSAKQTRSIYLGHKCMIKSVEQCVTFEFPGLTVNDFIEDFFNEYVWKSCPELTICNPAKMPMIPVYFICLVNSCYSCLYVST